MASNGEYQFGGSPVDPLVTITICIDRNGDVFEDTATHDNSFADVYRGIHKVRERVEELIANRRVCPFNPRHAK